MWRRTSLVLELAILVTAALAASLTAGTLLHLTEPRSAALAWILCAGLAGVGTAARRHLPAEMIRRHKRPLILLLTAALIWILLVVTRPTLRAGDGLFAEYFPNLTWTGPPAVSIVDANPSAARMRLGWDDMPPEQFSVRWSGFLSAGRPGLYSFSTSSDDGSQLLIDNQLVVDNRGMHGLETRSGSIRLDRGSHTVVLRYVQFGAASVLDWSWSRDGSAYAAVPAWALSQRRARYATVVSARIIDWGLWSFPFLIALTTAWYLRAGLGGAAARAPVAVRGPGVTRFYRNTASLVFSVVIYIAILLAHWPGGAGQWRFFTSAGATVRDLDSSVVTSLGRFRAFQADLDTAQAGEDVLPSMVREMLTMLRGHGVARYQLSDSVARDGWRFQQMVASAWPSKLEKDAEARFVLNTEPVMPGCVVIEKQRQVSLVHCP